MRRASAVGRHHNARGSAHTTSGPHISSHVRSCQPPLSSHTACWSGVRSRCLTTQQPSASMKPLRPSWLQ
eukprot:6390505-Prymnesium_polylepis.1